MAEYSYSINTFIGDSETVTWPIKFDGGYLSRDHVRARLWPDTGPGENISIAWVDDTTVLIQPPVPYGARFMIYRTTPKDKPLADFTDGAFVTETNLDTNAKQAVFIAAEAIDQGNAGVGELNTRAILVPVGEVAPHFPPRQRMKGKLVGIDLNGEIVGVGFNGFGSDYDAVLDAGQISFDGSNLRDMLRDTIDSIALTTEELEQQATAITDAGEQLALQSTSQAHLQSALTTLRNDHDSLVGVVDALANLDEVEGLATIIQQEQSERITADTAMAAKIALIGATNGDGTAFTLSLDNIKVGPDETLAQRLDYLDAEDGDAAALIEEERQARLAGDTAEASARQSLGTTLGTQIGAAVATEAEARSSAIAAEASARTQLAATLRNETDQKVTAAINSEASTRANADAAEATARTQLAATLRGETDQKVTAAVQSEATARAQADTAEATAREQLGTTLNGTISAQVQTERDARVNADAALASTISLIGAVTNGGTAFQLDSAKVLVNGGQALGQRLSGIDTAINGVSATVSNLDYAISNPSGAVASRLSSLEARTGSTEASIITQASAIAGLGGRTSAFWQVTGVAGNGRAQMRLYADANGGGGVDIIGDVSISGNLVVGGSIDVSKFDRSTMFATSSSSQVGVNYEPPAAGLYYFPNVGADMTVREGGSIYLTLTGSYSSTYSLDTTIWNSIEILDASNNAVLASVKFPYGYISGDQLQGHLVRIANSWGARTIRWRLGLRRNAGGNFTRVSNPDITVHWTFI